MDPKSWTAGRQVAALTLIEHADADERAAKAAFVAISGTLVELEELFWRVWEN